MHRISANCLQLTQIFVFISFIKSLEIITTWPRGDVRSYATVYTGADISSAIVFLNFIN